MARDKRYDYAQMVMMPGSVEKPRLPGTVELAMHLLGHRCIDTAIVDGRDNNAAAGCPASDPQVLLQIVFFADSRGSVSSRKSAQAWRETITFLALACGMVPEHRTMAAFGASRQEAILSLCREVLLVCEEPGWLGGTHVALDGLKLSSNAAKEWRGTFDALRQQQEHVEAQVQRLLEAHARADHEGATASLAESRAAPDTLQEQLERLENQAARLENFVAPSAPRRGKRGKELQRNGTANASATRQTAHGGSQGDKAHARVESTPQVIGPAEAFGHGQDDGPGAPMVEGAKAPVPAIGLPAEDCEGRLFSADSTYHRAGHLKRWAGEKLDAALPDRHLRAREPRVATPGRHTPHTAEPCTRADFTYAKEHERSTCPAGKGLKREARRHKIGNNIDRRDAADAVDCDACPLREKC